MRKAYASTFISGMQDTIIRALKEALPDVNILETHDGIVRYETHVNVKQLQNLRFFNNTFATTTLCTHIPKEEPLKQLIKAVREDEELEEKLQEVLPRKGTYTIMASVENQPTSLPPLQRQKLEKKLAASCSLSLNRQSPTTEFWLVTRRDGFGFFGIRVTRQNTILEKGELRPELCHLLCLLSEPSKDDCFLDLFCGSGAIPIERTRSFPFKEVWACDTDPKIVQKLKEKVEAMKLHMNICCCDALHLTQFPNGSFDKVVTDPPWGLFQGKQLNYSKLLQELCRVVKTGGRIVLLLSRHIPLHELLEHHSRLTLLHHYNILTSGRKASIYKLKVLR